MLTSKSLWNGGLGRFGNTCFTLAALIGIARKNGQPFGVQDWIIQDNLNFGGQADNMADYFENKLPPIPEGINFTDINYHWDFRDYNIPTGNYNLCSHLQNPKYFDKFIDEVRFWFTMNSETPQNDYIAVHYRAGDYIDSKEAYHPRLPIEYYEQAMEMLGGNQTYLFFSDEKPDKKKWKQLFSSYDVEIINKNYLESFKLMKRCKSFIIANSSFSYFASILGDHPDKKIVMPMLWFGGQANGLTFNGYHKDAIIL